MTVTQSIDTRLELVRHFENVNNVDSVRHQRIVLNKLQEWLELFWESSRMYTTVNPLIIEISLPLVSGKTSMLAKALPSWIDTLESNAGGNTGVVRFRNAPDIKEFYEPLENTNLYSVYDEIPEEPFKTLILDDVTPYQQTAEGFVSGDGVNVWSWLAPKLETQMLSNSEGNSVVINVCSRSAENDISAHLADFTRLDFNYRCLAIPALNDKGVSYWPERHGAEQLERKRKGDAVTFSAYFQQYLDQGNK